MGALAGLWIGTLYGTNTGNVFMEIEDTDGSLTGTIRINDPTAGVTIFEFTGVANDTIRFDLVPAQAPDGVEITPGTATAVLQEDGGLTGRWETELGTAGTFQVYRHRALEKSDRAENAPKSVPEQVFFHTLDVGAVRLYKADLEKLLDSFTDDFVRVKPVVTYADRGSQVSKFADALLHDFVAVPLKSLKVSIQEPEPNGITKLINVDLLEGAGSQIRTSASNESWVIGKAQMLRTILQAHENKLVNWYRRYGLTINTIIFFVMLIAVPEITDWKQRAGFVGVVFVLLTLLAVIYNRLVPNTLLFLSDHEPSWWSRAWPTILSWFAAVTSSVVAMWVFWLFTRD